MPRINGIRCNRDHVWYDTNIIEPGEYKRDYFTNHYHIGHRFKTNMYTAGQLASDWTSYVTSFGIRLVGKTLAEEDLLLDHLHATFIMGDIPQYELLGPQASMLRHTFCKEELEHLERDGVIPEPHSRLGYRFLNPVIVPVRQYVNVVVEAAKTLPEAVVARVFLFGYRQWRS